MSQAPKLLFVAILATGLPSLASAAPPPAEYDDCEAGFIAALGADAYQFSPDHRGELGTVRLFAVLSYQRAAAQEDWGQAYWRLQIRSAKRVVYEAHGVAPIDDAGGKALVEHHWDGRNQAWRPLPAGRYRYTFQARFLPDRVRAGAERYEDLAGVAGVEEAFASSDEILLDHRLPLATASSLRLSANATTCQVQQHAPIEASFGYNYYYGSTHAHSNFSDGGQPVGNCTSGNAYGSGTHQPTDVFSYARNVAGLDFWLINEHNHLINDSVATNLAPVTEAKVRQRYQNGRAAAAAASIDDAFVALYGMEWGVSSNPDQGHVTLLETPVLFGWETCTGCNGPSAECTPGTNCYFDVFTPKRYGYLTMYQRSVQNPSPVGPLGILAHPGSGEFDDYAFDANADAALQGIAIRSGLAFSTAENCADANVGATDYSPRWRYALNRGFHLGPIADHDSHCVNYGQGIPTRTVYLIPNGTTPVLTRNNLMLAHRARHFFATEDPNAQLVFAIADGSRVMGDIFSTGSSLTLRGALYDPNGDAVQTLELWRGQVGAGALTAPYRTFTGASFSATESPGTGTWYYFVHAVQADGHDVWSAPMWITFGGGGCTDSTAPVVSITAPPSGATISCANTVVQVTASDAAGIASTQVQVDGGAWNAATWNATSGRFEYTWPSATAASGAHTLAARATDASCGANVGTATPVTVTVSNTGCGGGSALAVGGWTLNQASSTATYILPAGTTIPADGYLVIARSATKAAFQTFWGVTLGANVTYLDSAGVMPVINGSETYTLTNSSGGNEDGPTIAMAAAGGQSIRRSNPCGAPGSTASWTTGATTTANPGAGAAAGCGTGAVIHEIADTAGTGTYVYEFVELHFDTPAAADTQAPTTAVTAPAAGATVSGTVTVAATAADNVGVSRVELLVDGALLATDTTSPYSFSWNSTAVANGAHGLASRAFDAAGNTTTSSAVAVTVSNGTDVSGWRLAQANSTLSYTLPAGSVIPSQGYLIVARNASKAAFQTFWGVTLGSNVVFVNAADAMPQINGSETFTLYNAAGTNVDGATYAMAAAGGQSLRRKDPCNAVGTLASWNIGVTTLATPGSGAGAGCAKGPVLNEVADAAGSGNFVYEFVELHNDR